MVETTKTLHMLRSNDVSKDAECDRHATVTNVTQKAHGCRYSKLAEDAEKAIFLSFSLQIAPR